MFYLQMLELVKGLRVNTIQITFQYLLFLALFSYACTSAIKDEITIKPVSNNNNTTKQIEPNPCDDCCILYADVWCSHCAQCACCRNCSCEITCPIAKNVTIEQANFYREFRENYLKNEAFGRKIIILYQENSARVSDLLEYSTELKELYKQTILEMLEYYLSFRTTGTKLVDSLILAKISNLLDKLVEINNNMPSDSYNERLKLNNDINYIKSKIIFANYVGKSVSQTWSELKSINP